MAIATTSTDSDRRTGRTHVTSFWQRNENWLLGSISMLLFLAIWEIAVELRWVNPLFTSSPSQILRSGYELFAGGGIFYDLQISGLELFVGYGLAILIGVPLGIL